MCLWIITGGIFSGDFVVAALRPGSSPPTPCPPLSPVSTVWQVPVRLTAWGLMAGLQRFASHGSSLHLGADCQ